MKYFLMLVLYGSFSVFGTEADFPLAPDLSMTPGALCTTPTRYRYPENIPYCDRLVDRALKDEVFSNYRRKGFSLAEPRDHYKIDHFIPLCAGGSNELKNLWPQHQSIFSITDEVEGLGCSKLQAGVIKQRDLLALVKKVKYDLSKAPEVLKFLYSL